MTRTVMTVELDDPLNDELGLKEAALMALEPLGGRVRVTVVRTIGEEQLTMAGADPVRPSRPGPGRKPAPGGQAPLGPGPGCRRAWGAVWTAPISGRSTGGAAMGRCCGASAGGTGGGWPRPINAAPPGCRRGAGSGGRKSNFHRHQACPG